MVKPGDTPEHLVQAADFTATAADLVRLGRYRRASSAGYYAVFHTAQALLATTNTAAETHSDVMAMLAKHFVKNGPLPSGTSRLISRLMDDRLLADYGVRNELDLAGALESVADAAAVVQELLAALGTGTPESTALRQEATRLAETVGATPPPTAR